MPFIPKYDYDLLALQLDDYVVREGPVDIHEICAHLDVERPVANRTIRHHRNHLSDPERALVAEIVGKSHYVYTISADPERIERWSIGRIRDGYSRSVTIAKQMQVAVNLTDGRKPQGRMARTILRHVNHMIEDVQALLDEVA